MFLNEQFVFSFREAAPLNQNIFLSYLLILLVLSFQSDYLMEKNKMNIFGKALNLFDLIFHIDL